MSLKKDLICLILRYTTWLHSLKCEILCAHRDFVALLTAVCVLVLYMLSWEAGFFRVSGRGLCHTIQHEGGPTKPPHAYSVAAVLPLRVISLSSVHEETLRLSYADI